MKQIFLHCLILLSLASISIAEQTNCVCDCVYVRTAKIRNHQYFQSPGNSCNLIEGRACLGKHRSETFRGRIDNCELGPSQLVMPEVVKQGVKKDWTPEKNLQYQPISYQVN